MSEFTYPRDPNLSLYERIRRFRRRIQLGYGWYHAIVMFRRGW